MTEQRVVSSEMHEVEWLSPSLQYEAAVERSYFKFHKYLLVCQMVPHPWSWPDRNQVCELRAVARDSKARCHYDVSSAKLPPLAFFSQYTCDYEGPEEEEWKKSILMLRVSIRWKKSMQKEFKKNTVHRMALCIHTTSHDFNKILRMSRLEPSPVKFLGVNLQRALADS